MTPDTTKAAFARVQKRVQELCKTMTEDEIVALLEVEMAADADLIDKIPLDKALTLATQVFLEDAHRNGPNMN